MARPLSKSPPISFRLTLEDYANITRRAVDVELTVPEYCAWVMTAWARDEIVTTANTRSLPSTSSSTLTTPERTSQTASSSGTTEAQPLATSPSTSLTPPVSTSTLPSSEHSTMPDPPGSTTDSFPTPRAAESAKPPSGSPVNCQHLEPRLVGGGLRVCDGCDSIRGADKVWRVRDRD